MGDVSPIFAELRTKTAPQLIAEHARAKPGEIAFRSKYRGLYRERTWRDYANLVGRMATQILRQRLRIQLTAGLLRASCLTFGRMKYCVRKGDRRLHTMSITQPGGVGQPLLLR